jgi:hypothetical protein
MDKEQKYRVDSGVQEYPDKNLGTFNDKTGLLKEEENQNNSSTNVLDSNRDNQAKDIPRGEPVNQYNQ